MSLSSEKLVSKFAASQIPTCTNSNLYRSYAQVLTPLNKGDVVTVSVLPAVAEEALFRGALLPALGGGPVGVVGAGVVFGALHAGGGRNAAFAAGLYKSNPVETHSLKAPGFNP